MRITPLRALAGAVFVVIVVVVTALLTPASVPAYDAAVSFVQAAGRGDDNAASALLTPELRAWVAQNCRDGSVAACVDDYTPPEWGGMLSAVFRRAQPDGPQAFNIQIIATYEDNQGFSGVCIYTRTERQPDDRWLVARWSGWFSCDEPLSGLDDLIDNPSVPHRAP
jgi:hypothetical protein